MLSKTRNRIKELERKVTELEYSISLYIPLCNAIRIKEVLRGSLNHLNLDISGNG
uniref:Uncharacterized protein n=1 Tax=viral metagenome TaxID=1070528 RepID=A0A6M3IM87_9ZZZZ